MTAQIKFGTSGWRAIIAEDFTVANVRRAVTGIARYVISRECRRARASSWDAIRDTWENALSRSRAEVLAAFGVKPLVIAEPAPTPAISYEVIRRKADGAINFTASHNPPEYSGIKFSTPDGAPALPEVTTAIESLMPVNGESWIRNGPAGTPETIDPKPAYLARLKEIIDLPLIREVGIESCL